MKSDTLLKLRRDAYKAGLSIKSDYTVVSASGKKLDVVKLAEFNVTLNEILRSTGEPFDKKD